MRRAVALSALVVIVLLIALGVHSCDVSSTNSALQNYTNNVSSLISQSDQTGTQLFAVLEGAGAKNSPTSVQNSINQARYAAQKTLDQAKHMSVPSQVQAGNQKLLLALQMRFDGISNIANEIQPALGTSASANSINRLAAETARFYTSDVVYKDYAAPEIASAVNHAGVRFSPLNPGQFVPNVQWLLPSYIAQKLAVPGARSTHVAPGLHGHTLNSVTAGGNQLQPGGVTNTLTASPAPTFTLNFTNGGTNNESDVVCKVTISATGVSGQTVVPHTTAGQSSTCTVKLNGTPPTGTHSVVATIEKVPGEKNLQNNTLTYTVNFQ